MPPGGRARRLVGWGVVAWSAIGGLILIAVAWRVLSRFAGVFGISARDPLTFVLVPVVLTLVAALAAIIPARRAGRVEHRRVDVGVGEPLGVLRHGEDDVAATPALRVRGRRAWGS